MELDLDIEKVGINNIISVQIRKTNRMRLEDDSQKRVKYLMGFFAM